MGRKLFPAVVAAALSTAAFAAPAHAEGTPAAVPDTAGDINGDGYADQVSAAPNGTVHGKSKAGYVVVTYGTANGVDTARHQGASQQRAGVPGTVESGDRFGSTLAVADVDGDGYADVILGSEGEDIGTAKGAGQVTILFGGKSGLSSDAIAFHEPKPAEFQRFSQTLTTGDFDQDGFQDIAIGNSDQSGGKVAVVHGAKNLRDTPTPAFESFTPHGGGVSTSALTSGDVNGDGYADLLTEASSDDPADEATLSVYPGSKDGLKTAEPSGSVGLPFAGYHPSAGDVNGDGKDDVVIDTGWEDGPDEYKLRTYPGSAKGLDTENPVVWKGKQHSGVGSRLTDLDGDGHADLVIADTDAPDSDGINSAGAITVLKGTSDWLTDAGAKKFSLDTPGVYGVAEGGDRFGEDVAPADYNGDGIDDLAIGVPGKHDASGAVSMLYGGKDGLTADGSIIFGPSDVEWPAQEAGFGSPVGFAPLR